MAIVSLHVLSTVIPDIEKVADLDTTDATKANIAAARKMLRSYGVNRLLTVAGNPKTDKAAKRGYATAIMHFAPANLSGYEVCPKRSAGCTAACLHTAGNPVYMAAKERARIARTRFYFERPNAFRVLLMAELASWVAKVRKLGLIPSVRLNGTSDIVWEVKFPEVFARFADVQFYDYTKIPQRFNRPLPANYHLTFSRSEDNGHDVAGVLAKGGNVAVVFSGCGIAAHPKPLPASFAGAPVVDGDEHDLTFLHGRGVVVGLRHKGNARGDASGFVVDGAAVAAAVAA